ncbi:hypothetical protein [Anabaena sp. CA = ATCC 33047]|uniref:hypothetical protein n=1 Tax=Anabaena sp. (strain CA / ATCC 33047) TaxID=52271 RepID=UPI00082D0337|nr:hypothetical protein [Anabaena sp. CA = ATCC 33047]
MIKYHQLAKYLGVLCLSVVLTADLVSPSAVAQTRIKSSVGKAVTFSCQDNETTIKLKNGPKVVNGLTTIYIGYQQVSSINQNPILIRFDNGRRRWCRTDYETTLDDGTGYGLYWDGGKNMYGVFSATGTQNGNDFRRFATQGWLTSYGSGGGAKVAVLTRIDPGNGNITRASFLSARKPSDGKTNSLVVTGLSWNGKALTVNAQSWWSPRRRDRSSMTCSGSSPFQYTVVFSGDLKRVDSASAVNCR